MFDTTLYILACIAVLLIELIVLVCELTEWVKLRIKVREFEKRIAEYRTSGYICTESDYKNEPHATTYSSNTEHLPFISIERPSLNDCWGITHIHKGGKWLKRDELLGWQPVDNGNDAPPPPPTTGSNVHDARRQKRTCFKCGREIAEGYICPACLEDD